MYSYLGPYLIPIYAALLMNPQLDASRAGAVDIGAVAKAYDSTQHPDVLAGKMTAKDAMASFLDTFDVGGEIEGRVRATALRYAPHFAMVVAPYPSPRRIFRPVCQVTKDEFLAYYTNVGAAIDEDAYFEALVGGVWGLHPPRQVNN